MHTTGVRKIFLIIAGGLAGCTGLVVAGSTTAAPVSAADAPTQIDLLTAGDYSVLAASSVTNTGPSVLNGWLGLSPQTSVTGFPPGTVNGETNVANGPASLAKDHLSAAYGVAAGLNPTVSGLSDLGGLSLTPGVYSGGELSLNGQLTLAGTADSVWVFQADSTFKTGAGSSVILTGEASICNVYWQVGSAATLGASSTLVGTVMASDAVTVGNGVTVSGRLMALTAEVTLINDRITAPEDCPPSVISPVFTGTTTPGGTVGTSYEYDVTSTGSPSPTYTVTSGALPAGLTFDADTGSISGTPTATGSSTFTITATNGTGPDAVREFTIDVQAAPVTPPTGGGSGGDTGNGGTGGSGTGGSGGSGSGSGTGTTGSGTGTGGGNAAGGSGSTTVVRGSGSLAATGAEAPSPLLTAGPLAAMLAGATLLIALRRRTLRRRG